MNNLPMTNTPAPPSHIWLYPSEIVWENSPGPVRGEQSTHWFHHAKHEKNTSAMSERL